MNAHQYRSFTAVAQRLKNLFDKKAEIEKDYNEKKAEIAREISGLQVKLRNVVGVRQAQSRPATPGTINKPSTTAPYQSATSEGKCAKTLTLLKTGQVLDRAKLTETLYGKDNRVNRNRFNSVLWMLVNKKRAISIDADNRVTVLG